MAMAQTQTEPEAAPSHSSRLPLILGLVLMIAGGGASFAALYLGLLPAGHGAAQDTATGPAALPDIAYVALEPMVISLSDPAARHLRFSAQIEVPAAYQKDVELLRPRVVDVLNGYLRAGEDAVAARIQELLAGKIDSARIDVMGNLIVEKKGRPGGKTIMLSAHMDQIGLAGPAEATDKAVRAWMMRLLEEVYKLLTVTNQMSEVTYIQGSGIVKTDPSDT